MNRYDHARGEAAAAITEWLSKPAEAIFRVEIAQELYYLLFFPAPGWEERLMKVKTAEFVTSAFWPADYPREQLPEVAFSGRSNVGKSSMINSLLNRRAMAKVSGTPGRTRTINFFRINRAMYIVDLPGYGYAKVSRAMRAEWKKVVESYLRGNEHLCAVVVILDSRREPSAGDRDLVDWLRREQVQVIPVVTKSDKLSRNALSRQMGVIADKLDLERSELEPFSARTGLGKARLWGRINSSVEEKRSG